MGDLKTQLAQHGPLEPGRAVDVIRQIAAAIDDAHAHRSVHHGVTTETVLLADDGSARLADTEGTTPSTERTRTLVTDTQAAYGADISALTAVLYECLTGHPPNASAMPPSQQKPGVPAGFDAVIARGLAANPDDRYRSTTELVEAAQAALSAAVTQTIDLPPRQPNPPPPQWDPAHNRTISYPHTRPVAFPPPPRRRNFAPLIAVIAIVVVVVVAAFAIPKLVHHPGNSAAPKTTTTSTPPQRNYTGLPTALPFPGLGVTTSVGVDGAGNIYALASLIGDGSFDTMPTMLFKLAPGAGDAAAVDIPGVNVRSATDFKVDQAGNIYYSEGAQVWMLEAGKTSPMRLQFRGFSKIDAITFDSAGNVYAVGGMLSSDLKLKYGVKKLAPGENRPTDLSFGGLYVPKGIAVDKAGNVYVSSGIENTGHGKVVKLAPGATSTTTLPIPDILEPRQIAFDSAGNVFVADGFGRRFFELPAGGGSAISIPIPASSHGVAVDSADNLYVLTGAIADQSDKSVRPGQVLKVVPEK
ncbi:MULTISPECIES: hypothetical protein [unclassified Mycobacterium]|uniref:hypothetical protein n=1 Tax=unclassified Mycobacterium TaxID=2642494 RepID=UPI0027403E3C|nr:MULTISPECIES: hypothetical protein [unclassified Mycobacterium]MDP7702349.1 hypothetical protein [Mycobacterium sp. TY815]MDP7720843.1 hypothetical protein [Mycobacterium sp. TY814]